MGATLDNLLNALANKIKLKYAAEENKGHQVRQKLSQLEQRQSAEVIDLPAFRQLLKEELEKEDARKAALHSLISGIEAHPDRKVMVNFRIGERVKGTHRGQHTDPHQSTYPVPDMFQIRV